MSNIVDLSQRCRALGVAMTRQRQTARQHTTAELMRELQNLSRETLPNLTIGSLSHYARPAIERGRERNTRLKNSPSGIWAQTLCLLLWPFMRTPGITWRARKYARRHFGLGHLRQRE